ncbi:cation diffusion facilitator family transporter [Sinorhizobium alkalisoli]|uniref:Cobalt-zinc-cadmium resistance protein CzcD n=1 Tax=Sinorhizobium alkalisoli TaxID=1752398 RepID=A0A1E3VG77_9HYPH|nr:cation diffusion facilitator family transporter [Sinorhizobium alkalisoli]ODR92131.1 hypothetical protein A8M32_06780 [Sinorhizobium alkalisoli]
MAHAHRRRDHEESGWRYLVALVLNIGIALAELVGGVLSGSLSLIADAAHNASDAASIGVSFVAWRISKREPDRRRTFGYRRAETIGALINLTTLFVMGVYLLYEAASRLADPHEIGGWTMVIVGAIAFVEDLASVWVLSKNRGSLNMKSASLHMVADTMATVGVISGGILVLLFDIAWIDPVVTAAIAVYIFIHAYREIRHAIALLMESAPADLDLDELVGQVEAIAGVEDLHHVHVWQPDETRRALEAHVAVSERDLEQVDQLKKRIKELLIDRYRIGHVMLEIELAASVDHDRDVIGKEN